MNEIIERIQESIARKRERIPSSVAFSGPEDNVPADQQAMWMVQLLQHTYHHHAMTDRQSEVAQSIRDGSTRCFFAHENGEALAVAARIVQPDGAWELGRAAASTLQRGIGGVVMLSAAQEHFTRSGASLVAEVRVSQAFEGVPGGAATQKICLRDIGLQPHALLPLFGHGDPHRQEQFLLSASKLEQNTQPISAPLTNGIGDCFSKLISPLGSLRGFKVALKQVSQIRALMAGNSFSVSRLPYFDQVRVLQHLNRQLLPRSPKPLVAWCPLKREVIDMFK